MANTQYPMVFYEENKKNKKKECFSWVYKICPEDPFRVFVPGEKTTWGKKKKDVDIEIMKYFNSEAEATGE